MARNAGGTYALPAGNPVVTGTVVASSWANTTLSDLATEMTDSLDRSGKGGMLAPLLLVDGAVGLPGIAFNSEPSTGMYRAAANDLRFGVAGVDAVRITPGGTNPRFWVVSSQAAGNTTTDFNFTCLNGRTAGLIFNLQNNLTVRASATNGGGWVFNSENAAAGGGTDFFFSSTTVRTTGTLFGVANNGATRVSLSGLGANSFFSQLATGDAGTDHLFGTATAVNRTAGKLFDFQNNATTVFNLTNGAAVANAVLNFAGAQFNFNAAAATINFAGATSATILASGANVGLLLQGNKNAADAGADFTFNSTATRSAGELVDFNNNGTTKAQVNFNGVVQAPNTMQVSEITANSTNSTITMASVTGLSFPVSANADYYAEFFLLGNDTATATLNVQLTGPAAPTIIQIGGQGIFGTTATGNGAAAFSTPFVLMPTNITTEAGAVVRMLLRNGANAGTVQLQFASGTAGQTVTLFAGSLVRWQRVDNAGLA